MDADRIAERLVRKAADEVTRRDIENGMRSFAGVEEALDALEGPWDKHWSFGIVPDPTFVAMSRLASDLRKAAVGFRKRFREEMADWKRDASRRTAK